MLMHQIHTSAGHECHKYRLLLLRFLLFLPLLTQHYEIILPLENSFRIILMVYLLVIE